MKKKQGTRATEWIVYIILILVCIYAIFPLYWGISTSFKERSHIMTYPVEWVPRSLTLEHYRTIFRKPATPWYFLNSFLVSSGTVAIVLLVSCLAAYAATRFNFAGKKALMFIPLILWMIPPISIITPLYLIIAKTGLLDSRFALILVCAAVNAPIGAWLIRSFFQDIPLELDDAAMIDGCSRLQALFRVILPLSWAGLFACAMLVFVRTWNIFLFAQTFLSSEEKMVVQVGLYRYVTEYGIDWGALMAMTTLALIPPAVLFIALQKHFVHALSGARVG